MMKSLGFDVRENTSSKLEDSVKRLSLVVEEMEHFQREEERTREMGNEWKDIAQITDRCK